MKTGPRIHLVTLGCAKNLVDSERILGRLDAQLEYSELAEILAEGVSSYLHRIEAAIHDAAVAVQRSYFMH